MAREPKVTPPLNNLIGMVWDHLPEGYEIYLRMRGGDVAFGFEDPDGNEIENGFPDLTIEEQIVHFINLARTRVGEPLLTKEQHLGCGSWTHPDYYGDDD